MSLYIVFGIIFNYSLCCAKVHFEMRNLQRSFGYALIIYILLGLIYYLFMELSEENSSTKRYKVDPSTLHFKKEQKKSHLQKRNPSQKKASKKKPIKSSYPEKKKLITIDPKQVRTIKPPIKKVEEKTKVEKNIKLPQKDELIKSIFDNLPKAKKHKPKLSPQDQLIQELYGDSFVKLSSKAKKYLNDNHLLMQAITQKVLNRIGRVYLDPRFYYYDYNFVEFMLYPDGSISDIKMLKDAEFKLLNKITQETVETAFKDYPRPSEPTLIRYKFLYDLRSF